MPNHLRNQCHCAIKIIENFVHSVSISPLYYCLAQCLLLCIYGHITYPLLEEEFERVVVFAYEIVVLFEKVLLACINKNSTGSDGLIIAFACLQIFFILRHQSISMKIRSAIIFNCALRKC